MMTATTAIPMSTFRPELDDSVNPDELDDSGAGGTSGTESRPDICLAKRKCVHARPSQTVLETARRVRVPRGRKVRRHVAHDQHRDTNKHARPLEPASTANPSGDPLAHQRSTRILIRALRERSGVARSARRVLVDGCGRYGADRALYCCPR